MKLWITRQKIRPWLTRKDISTPRKVWSIVLLIAGVSFLLIGLCWLPAMLLFGPLSLACFVGSWHVARPSKESQ